MICIAKFAELSKKGGYPQTRGECFMKNKLKRGIALLLVASLCQSNGLTTFASSVHKEEDALKASLAAEADKYPNGAFAFSQTQLEGKEGGKKLELVVVRKGETDSEASIDFKAVNISATYGKDYTLTVKENALMSKELKDNKNAIPMTETYTDGSFALGEEASAGKVSSSAVSEEEDSDEKETAEQGSNTLIEKDSALKTARNAYLGEASDREDWQKVNSAADETGQEVVEQGKEAIEQFAQDIEGIEETLYFGKGEYKKVIEIDIKDDDIAESDEQVMFLLSNANNAELADEKTAYLNIADNDTEDIVFAMKEDSLMVNKRQGTVKVTIERTTATETFASATVGTVAIDAVPGEDYEAVNTEVIFPQGVTEQTIEIPIINNKEQKDMVTFAVAIDKEKAHVEKDKHQTVVTLYTDDKEVLEDDDIVEVDATKIDENGAAAVASTTKNTDVYTADISANVSNACNTTNTVTYISGADLRFVEKINFNWKSDEGSRTISRKKCDGGDYTVYDRTTSILIGGTVVASRTGRFGWTSTGEITIPTNKRIQNVDIQIRVQTTGENNSAKAWIGDAIVTYVPYKFKMNCTNTNGNQLFYTEKIYMDNDGSGSFTTTNGHTYKNGKSIKLGEATISSSINGTNAYSTDVTVYKPGKDTLLVKHDYSNTGTNSNGVNVKVSSAGNAYLAGYQLRNPGVLSTSSNAWTDVIAPGELAFTPTFMEKYKANLMDNNTFEIRPVYKPYPATIVFENADTAKGGFSNGFKNAEILRCTQLDTFKVKGIANSGYAEVNLQNYQSTELRNLTNQTSLASKAKEFETIATTKQVTVSGVTKTEKVTNDTSKYKSVTCENKIQNDMEKNVITFSPVGEINYISLGYHKSKITLAIDPKSNNKDKGSVLYSDEENDILKEGTWSASNPNGATIEVEDVLLNSKLYYFSSVIKDQYEGQYRTFWKDWTGDNNRDGNIDDKDGNSIELREKYKLVDTASYGNTFAYIPKLSETLIYYGFEPKAKNDFNGILQGKVYLSTTPVFGSKETKTVLPGATVTIDGKTVTTDKEGKYFFSGEEFTTAENYTVNIQYDGLLLTDTQAVNAGKNFTLQAYDTFSVAKDSKILQGNKEVGATGVSTKDSNVSIILNTVSSVSALVAKKAEVSFYRKDGTKIGDSMIIDNGASNTGIFTITFNPKTKSIPAGAGMKVRFYDQNGKGYYEHDMGVIFMEDLGILSILSSFNFGGAEKALSIIGKIDSTFNFGWDGDVTDADSPYITISGKDTPEDLSDDTTTLSYGFKLNYETEKEDLLGDKEDAPKDAAKKSLDKGGDAKKEKSKLAANAYINFSFAIGMTMQKSEKELGKWYFKDLTLLIEADGGGTISAQFMTPIGVPIMVSCTGSAEGAALMVIQQKDDIECYFNNLRDGETGTIDLFKFNTRNSDAPLEAYGEFRIAPTVTLAASVGFSWLNVGLKGSAAFDFNFYTQADKKNSGNVNLAAYLTLKLLLFSKEFKIASKDFNLFGDATAKALSLSDEDYLQTSLAEMELNDRSYLENRTKWNGGKQAKTQSVASTSGVEEQQLMDGIYPYPDIQMEEIGDGKYLAVFTDDVPERSKENSTAVYYTIYNGSTWSTPKIVEDDGTLDDSPTMLSCGDQILVAWSSADQVFDQDVNAIEMLQSRNIHGRFFDKKTGKFGDVQTITKTTAEDITGDVQPSITYDEESQRMMVYYTKSEYSESNAKDNELSDAVIADAVFPYSLISYRTYNMKTNTWEEGYSEADVAGMKAGMKDSILEAGLATEETYDTYFDETFMPEYTANWYGQSFLDLAPTVSIDETLDEAGYWTEEPTISAYTGTNDPNIVESIATSYNGLGLYFYVLDYDANEETTNDRDIFLQIYNFEEDSFSHPVMITNDEVQDSNLRIIRMDNATILGYLSDGKIMTLDVSHLVKHNLVKGNKDGAEYYYVDKTNYLAEEAASDSTEDIYSYIPPMCVVDKQGEQDIEDVDHSLITGFDLKTKDNYAYAIWTQQDVTLKDGIDEDSEEATKVENRKIETQIYASRYDGETGNITDPIQVTEENGANYSQIAFMVTEEGGMKALAAKSQSIVEEITEEEEGIETSFVADDTKNRTLVALDFKPTSVLTLTGVESSNLVAGGIDVEADNAITLSFKNEGMDTISGSVLEIKDKDGNVVYTEDAKTIGEIYGGKTYTTTFNLPLDENATGCELEIIVKDKNGTILLSESYKNEIPVNLVVDSMDAELTDRGELTVHATVTNESQRKAPASKVEIGRLDGETTKTALGTIDVPALQMGESVTVSKKFKVDYEKDFALKQAEDGSYGADVRLYTKSENESITYETVSVWATAQQLKLMKAIDSVVISNGDDLTGDIQLTQGRITKINANVKLNPFDSGVENDGSNDKDYVNNFANGLKVIWTADNDEVVKVYDNGYMEGLKEGTTTLHAYIMPADNEVVADIKGNGYTKNNIVSLPDQAIRKESIKVTVEKATIEEKTVITLDKNKVSIPVKGKSTLKATVTGSLADKTVTWTSSNPKIAAVSQTGMVTGKKAGTVTITATTKDGKKAEAKVTVTALTLNKKSVTLGKGETFVIQSTLSKGSTDKLSGVTFKTSNKKVVSIVRNKNGKATIKANRTGKAKITVTTKSGAKQVLTVTVKKAPSKVTAKHKKVTLKKGRTKKLAISFPANSASYKVTYSSRNKKVATINKNGVIKAVKKGTTWITVRTFNGKRAQIKVIVK